MPSDFKVIGPQPLDCIHQFCFINEPFFFPGIPLKIIFKNEIANSTNPEETLQAKEKEYTNEFANPYKAAARGFIDEVIEPEDTRQRLIDGFEMLANKAEQMPKKKHGNIPL